MTELILNKRKGFKMKEIKRLVIHDGKFHADDVMTCALVRTAFPDVRIERVSGVDDDMRNDENTVIADIGLGKYDHHQPDAPRRPYVLDNQYTKTAPPITYKAAACGLIFEDIKDMIFKTKESANFFFENYIRPIEAQDNVGKGVAANPLSIAIGAFNTISTNEEDVERRFFRAVHICEEIICAEAEAEEERLKSEGEVEKYIAKSEDGILILPKYMHWCKAARKAGLNYAVMPGRDGFALRPVRGLLPADWLNEKPNGANFVHQGRFIAVFRTKEYAVEAAKKLSKEGA